MKLVDRPSVPRLIASAACVSRAIELVRWLALGVIAFALTSLAPAATPPLRVCLVSGANDSAPYNTDRTLGDLARYLENDHGMTCTLLTWDATTAGFPNIERLLAADVAIFFVRRKTPNAANLAVLKKFFSTGKGFIALRSTSHAWENWPDFDAEVLGAKYGGPKGGNFGNADKLIFQPHAIWAGGESFTTRCDLYRYGPVAADVTVILEGETTSGVTPVAWTRVHHGARLVHLALGYAYDLEQSAFRRIVANAVRWVSAPAEK